MEKLKQNRKDRKKEKKKKKFDPPVSRLELAGELGPLLLVLPLQVANGQRDALLTVCSQTSALRGGCGARR